MVSIYSCTPQEARPSWVRDYAVEDLGRYEKEMLEHMRTNHGDVLKAIQDAGKLEEDTASRLAAALDEFGKVFQPSAGSAGSEAD